MTRAEASDRLRNLLVRLCPEHAVEIFCAATDLASATLKESHDELLQKFDERTKHFPGGES